MRLTGEFGLPWRATRAIDNLSQGVVTFRRARQCGHISRVKMVTSLPNVSAVVFVGDVRRMTEFYRVLAAMDVLHADDEYAVLQLAEFQLVIHALRGAPKAGTAAFSLREDSYIKICLPVDSVDAARSRAASLGGKIKPKSNEFEARGFRACDGNDPEGNVIQVRESACSAG